METSIDVRVDFICFWGYSVVSDYFGDILLSVVISGEIRILAHFGPTQI